MRSSLPGLTRGLQVFNLLSTPMRLDAIVQATGIPKSTVLRILATLRAEGLVVKAESTRRYQSVMRLTPCDGGDNAFEEALERSLARLAIQTGQTAEWYLPTVSGQVLAMRYAPPHSEVHVNSWIGQSRIWCGYLDAVTCVGRAVWLIERKEEEVFWEFDSAGRDRTLEWDEVRRRLDGAATEGYAIDEHFSDTGVKRMACVVQGRTQPIGVVALAQCQVPGLSDQEAYNLEVLRREAATLTTDARTKLQRVEWNPPGGSKTWR